MDPKMMERLDNDFTYHKPNEKQAELYETIRAAAKAFASLIAELTPVSREQSVAFTKIDEAVFWANAAIARNS